LGAACLLGAQARDVSLQGSRGIQLAGKTERFALIIGVDRYEDSQINPLQGAANDARAVRNALIQYAGFPADQVALLTSDQTSPRQPTRGNILRRLSNLKALIPPTGLLLFFFAGHGIQQQEQGFLLCSDSQLSGDLALLRETALNVDSLRRYIRETGVRQVILILDACRNEPGGRSLADNPLGEALVNALAFDVRNREVEAFVTFYASAIGHRAYEFMEKKQGYFSWFLVEGLSGAAANERGEVTLASLIRYLQEQVPRRVSLDLGVGREQKPFVNFEGYRAEELVLAINPTFPRSVSPGTVLSAEVQLWRQVETSQVARDYKTYLEKYPGGRYADQALRRLGEMEKIASPIPGPITTQPARLISRPFTFETGLLNREGKFVERKKLQGKGVVGDCAGVPLELAYISGGTFPMGLSQTEIAVYQRNLGALPGRRNANPRDAIQGLFRMMLPQHLVTVPSFYLGRYEITDGQWNAVVRLAKVRRSLKARPASPHSLRYPVDRVSWEEAQEFCERLSRFSGRTYRLPSEPEWEYACRAGSMTPYYFGESFSPEMANCKATGNEGENSEPGSLMEVGSRHLSNPFGLFDMLGNVQEWCLDEWHVSYRGAPSDGKAWITDGKKPAFRVLRGGGWLTEGERCRSAERDFAPPEANSAGFGFRVVLEIPAK
jgi:formylglycine-generating enzyme required for sulfatase activity